MIKSLRKPYGNDLKFAPQFLRTTNEPDKPGQHYQDTEFNPAD